jgi:RNA-directed DNA polymerase
MGNANSGEDDAKMAMLCDPAVWQDVLARVRRKKGRRVDMESFGAVCDTTGRARLVQAIADGEFTLSPPKTLYVDKVTGLYLSYKEAKNREFDGVRTLYAPSQPLDGIVLGVVSAIYNKLYGGMINPACRSYQRGVGVRSIIHGDLVPRLKRNERGYKLDLSKYFDSVNRETLDATLTAMSSGSPLDDLVWKHFHDDRVFVNGELEPRYMAIRQGNAIGTLLANLALRDVDEELASMDVLYLRYADDMLILGKDADKALARLREMLDGKGLRLNDKKTTRIDSRHPFTFLGCEIADGRVDMSQESYDRVKRKIRLICRPHKYVPKESREEQMKAIRRINWLLRDGNYADQRNFGWERYFFSVIDNPVRLRTLDQYIREHVKGVYVGRQTQHRKAKALTSDDMLRSMGYKSLMHMYRASKCGPDVYAAELMEVHG